jgi:hypothetical protein
MAMSENANVCVRCGKPAVCVNPEGAVCNDHIPGRMVDRIAELETQVAEMKEQS